MKGMILAALAATCITSLAQEKKPARGDIFSIIGQQRKKADMTAAVSNAKQIFYLLVEFDQEYGEYPSSTTAKEFPGLPTKTSNDYFKQFFAARITKAEQIFYAKGGSKTKKKPDDDISQGKLLEAGEVGFAYIKGLSTASNSQLPLLCAPMTGKGSKFDPKPYGGKAVILHCDGSVRTYDIDKNGEVRDRKGKKIFDVGKGKEWGKTGFQLNRLVFPK